uniref:Uncharacterized protein n=1 Tax=viral metagenome TaxID=1070528 RepID=A0A6C0B0B1_9ZZZZ
MFSNIVKSINSSKKNEVLKNTNTSVNKANNTNFNSNTGTSEFK